MSSSLTSPLEFQAGQDSLASPTAEPPSLVHSFHTHNPTTLRARFTQATRTTHDQQRTELECAPYLTSISDMTAGQREHLRQFGLLAAASANDDDDDDDSSTSDPSAQLCLTYMTHLEYVSAPLATTNTLSRHMTALDASRSWLAYWCLQAQDLLSVVTQEEAETTFTASINTTTKSQEPPSNSGNNDNNDKIVATISSMWSQETIWVPKQQVEADSILKSLATEYAREHGTTAAMTNDKPKNNNKKCKIVDGKKESAEYDEDYIPLTVGGFGGGPHQLAHAATNYAAVLALCLIWTEDATQLLLNKRHSMYAWMALILQQQQQQQPDDNGSFRMHRDGEIDIRATYCLLSVAKLLNVLDGPSIRHDDAIKFVASCQTYEGGFGAVPFSEAHGGYTFCGVAAAYLLQGLDRMDTHSLTEWLVRRQMSYEGGFSGRTNKLVDGCYSFWVGGATAIISMLPMILHEDPWLRKDEEEDVGGDDNGVKGDTPPASTTVLFDQGMLERYTLTCAQDTTGGLRDKPSASRDHYHTCYNLSGLSVAQHCSGDAMPCFGHPQQSRVARTHPVYNIRTERVRQVLAFFQNHDKSTAKVLDTATE